MSALMVLGLVSAGIWIYLLGTRGGFWRGREWLAPVTPLVEAWPEVVAIIPARDEAEVIGRAVTSHLSSRYPGPFSLILVDDGSSDGTAEVADAAFMDAPEDTRRVFKCVEAPELPEGWTGKVAAQQAGVEEAARVAPDAKYFLFTDADIVHGPDVLEGLVAKAETENRALVSLMARLDDRGFWGGLLVPAFVFFFQKLYPFPRSNDPMHKVAAAAGGCMLVRKEDFEAAGGFEAMRNALIDDCMLARLVKGDPPSRAIWTGLTLDVISLRDNRPLTSIWSMVARSAYAQLDYSPIKLAGTLVGMVFTYLIGPVLVLTYVLHEDVWAAMLGLGIWLAMMVAYAPTLILYRQSIFNGFVLPIAGFMYACMTLSSALAHGRGQGGEWKGRTYSDMSGS